MELADLSRGMRKDNFSEPETLVFFAKPGLSDGLVWGQRKKSCNISFLSPTRAVPKKANQVVSFFRNHNPRPNPRPLQPAQRENRKAKFSGGKGPEAQWLAMLALQYYTFDKGARAKSSWHLRWAPLGAKIAGNPCSIARTKCAALLLPFVPK